MAASYSSQEGRRYALATLATLPAPLQAMLARVRKRVLDRSAEVSVVKRRILTKSSPGASTSLPNALLATDLNSGNRGNSCVSLVPVGHTRTPLGLHAMTGEHAIRLWLRFGPMHVVVQWSWLMLIIPVHEVMTAS